MAWLPLHGEPVDQITREMVKRRRDELVKSGPIAANQALAALSTLFAWGIDREHVSGANPTADIKPLKQTKRTRVPSEAELEASLSVVVCSLSPTWWSSVL